MEWTEQIFVAVIGSLIGTETSRRIVVHTVFLRISAI
jgi:hypothetical protein